MRSPVVPCRTGRGGLRPDAAIRVSRIAYRVSPEGRGQRRGGAHEAGCDRRRRPLGAQGIGPGALRPYAICDARYALCGTRPPLDRPLPPDTLGRAMGDHPSTPAATAHPAVREQDGCLVLRFEDGTVQSRMLAADPAALVLEYTRLMMGFLLFQPAPARIAMIGLGGGSLARYCARTLPAADFTAVEISPAVIALRDTFAVPADGPRFRVRCADGAVFVRDDQAAPLDVLLIDGFDRHGQPPQLCSAAFYDACRARLAAGGVLVVNLHTDDPDCALCLDRIRDAFAGHCVAVPARGSDNVVVFAGVDAPFPPPFATLLPRLRALEPHHPVDLGATMALILQQSGQPPRPSRRHRT